MRKPDPAHVLTDEELEELEKRIAEEYRKAADDLQEKIDTYFESFKERDAEQAQRVLDGEITPEEYKQWRLAQIGRGHRFEALRDRMAERYTAANEVAAAYINDTTPGIYSLNRNYAAYTIEQQVGRNVGFDLWDEQTVRRLIVEQPDLLPNWVPKREVNKKRDLAWGQRQITAQVTQGILQGESIPNIAKRLQEHIPGMERDSAVRAARTAVTGAQNAGRIDSYHAAQNMGIKMRKQWLATLDSRTRHAHAALDGKTAEVDDPFESELGNIMFPGDPDAAPANIYNCRCTLIAAVEGVDMSDAKRRARTETGENEVIENMTYSEWAEWKKNLQESSARDTISPEISGVKRGAQMTFAQADTGNVNPNYGTNIGYAINCQTCVPVFEARLRGYDVQAMANTSGSMLDKLSRKTNLVWIDPATGEHPEYIRDKTATTPKKYLSFISGVVQQGQRYSIEFSWKGRSHSGHIVNLDRNEDGKLRIKDNQRGANERSEWIGDKDVLAYLSQMKYTKTSYGYKFSVVPKLLRLDTMDFDFDVANQVMEARK